MKSSAGLVMPSGPASASPSFKSRLQKVPWHCHSNVQDTFYVIEGHLKLFLREPEEEVRLSPGDTYSVVPLRPHLVSNGGDCSATFLVLQGLGEYDYIPLT
jgi:quercetin dioxygenase-like cupin family protein